MQTRTYLLQLAALAAAAVAIGIILRVAFGQRWFGFYGFASLALLVLPVLGVILIARYRAIGLKRWPVVVVLLPALLAALVQIGFWLAFFEGGPATVPLSAGRSMVLPLLDPALLIGAITISVLLAWLIYRGAMKRGN